MLVLIYCDIGAANDASVVIVLLTQKRREILPANASREKAQRGELGLELWLLHRRSEPLC